MRRPNRARSLELPVPLRLDWKLRFSPHAGARHVRRLPGLHQTTGGSLAGHVNTIKRPENMRQIRLRNPRPTIPYPHRERRSGVPELREVFSLTFDRDVLSRKTMRLGKIVEGGQFEVVWSSEKPIRPEPYPSSRSATAWNVFLAGLFREWDGHWTKSQN